MFSRIAAGSALPDFMEFVEQVTIVLSGLAAGVAVWQFLRSRRKKREAAGGTSAHRSVAAPVGSAPARLHGRDREMSLLRKAVRRPRGRFVVLSGMGGVGKSALAVKLCQHRSGRDVWWISARTPETLTEGLVSVVEPLGGSAEDTAAIRAGTGRAQDRFWELLNRAPRGWLLVFDDADDIGVLGTLNGTGWVRHSDRGLVLITSRLGSRQIWGSRARVVDVRPLREADAARMLLDLAGDGFREQEARSLARRLGGLPLALHVAGTSLSGQFSRWGSFREYEHAFDTTGINTIVAPDGGVGDESDPRKAVMSTYELSLDSLAEAGVPEARPLLRLLSCFASAVPVPVSVLETGAVYDLLAAADGPRRLYAGLRGLAQFNLVAEHPAPKAVVLHPVVAETNRDHLRLDGRAIHCTAVEVVVAATAPMRFDNSATWPTARLLTPHVTQLLAGTAAYLDRAELARLLTAAASLVAVAAWSGAERDGERLAVDALGLTGPLGEDHPACLHLRAELGWAAGRHGNWEQARVSLASVLGAWERMPDAPAETVLDVRHKLAWATGRSGDWESAYGKLTEVGAARRGLLGDDHPDTLHTRCCLAWAAWRIGRPAEAERGYREVIEVRRRVLGDDHIETVDAYHSLGEGYVLEGRYAEAEATLRAVIADRDRILGPDHPQTLDIRPSYWLGRALLGQGRRREAVAVLAGLLDRQEAALGHDHPATVATRECLRSARQ